jgi:hypothetical protein
MKPSELAQRELRLLNPSSTGTFQSLKVMESITSIKQPNKLAPVVRSQIPGLRTDSFSLLGGRLSERTVQGTVGSSLGPIPLVTHLETISLFDEVNRRIFHLQQRLSSGDILLSSDGTFRPSVAEIRALHEYCREAASLAAIALSRMGVDLNATVDIGDGVIIPAYDFSFPTYDEWQERVAIALKSVAALSQSLTVVNVPNFAAQQRGREWDIVWLLLKLLSVLFGLATGQALLEALDELYPSKLFDLAHAYVRRDIKAIIQAFYDIFREIIKDSKFWWNVIGRIGPRAWKEALKNILRYAGPWTGTFYLLAAIASILWELSGILKGD